jgi:hypothetical protein
MSRIWTSWRVSSVENDYAAVAEKYAGRDGRGERATRPLRKSSKKRTRLSGIQGESKASTSKIGAKRIEISPISRSGSRGGGDGVAGDGGCVHVIPHPFRTRSHGNGERDFPSDGRQRYLHECTSIDVREIDILKCLHGQETPAVSHRKRRNHAIHIIHTYIHNTLKFAYLFLYYTLYPDIKSMIK